MTKEVSDQIQEIARLLDMLINTPGVPRNVKRTLSDVRNELLDESEELNVRIGNAIYQLEESAEDINIPMHARTQIWSILSALEKMIE
ncbi:UPF0147 family protein [Candidatus Micrarchaeota archaeon]|nr:UPF0147 family protein [Candidatus Micrarchaeota archaeon]